MDSNCLVKLTPIFGKCGSKWTSELIRAWNDFGDENKTHLQDLVDILATLPKDSRNTEYVKKYIYLFVKYLLKYGNKFYGSDLAPLYNKDGTGLKTKETIFFFRAIEYEELYGVSAEIQFIIMFVVAEMINELSGKLVNLPLSDGWIDKYNQLKKEVQSLPSSNDERLNQFLNRLDNSLISLMDIVEGIIDGTYLDRINNMIPGKYLDSLSPVLKEFREFSSQIVLSMIINSNFNFISEWMINDNGKWMFKDQNDFMYFLAAVQAMGGLAMKRTLRDLNIVQKSLRTQ